MTNGSTTPKGVPSDPAASTEAGLAGPSDWAGVFLPRAPTPTIAQPNTEPGSTGTGGQHDDG